MNISINGNNTQVEEQITVENLLLKLNIEKSKIAVELNQALLPRSDYSEKYLAEGDRLEIVAFVGGG